MIIIKNAITNNQIVKPIIFSGGELHININDIILDDNLDIICHIQNSNDLIELILFTEILQRHEYINHNLHIPYFPYARQDRITENSTSFSLKPICNIIFIILYWRAYLKWH